MTLEQRIEALERRCKRLGKTLVGVGTLALFAVVAGTAGWTVAYTGAISPSSITTSSIFLKDSAGKTRLSLFGSSGSISLKDFDGKTGVGLFGSAALISLKDKAGKRRLRLGGSGFLDMYDKTGRKRLSLRGKDSTIRAYDSAGTVRVRLDGARGKIFFSSPNTATFSHP